MVAAPRRRGRVSSSSSSSSVAATAAAVVAASIMATGLLLLALPRRAAAASASSSSSASRRAGFLWRQHQHQLQGQGYGQGYGRMRPAAAGFVAAPRLPPGGGVRALSALRRLAGKGKGKEEDPNDPSNMYRDTVTLPQTGFDQRANAVVREPQIQALWEEGRVYQSLYETAQGACASCLSVLVCVALIDSSWTDQSINRSIDQSINQSINQAHASPSTHPFPPPPTGEPNSPTTQAPSSSCTTARPTPTGTCTSGTRSTRS